MDKRMKGCNRMKPPFQIRTDLAIEAKDMYVENNIKDEKKIAGVSSKERKINQIKVVYVDIDQQGAETLGKKQGAYITIYADGVKKQDTFKQDQAAKVLGEELRQLLEIGRASCRERD